MTIFRKLILTLAVSLVLFGLAVFAMLAWQRDNELHEAEAQTADRSARVLEARIRALGGQVSTPPAAAQPETASRPAGGARLRPPLSAEPAERFGDGSSGWRWRATSFSSTCCSIT